MSHPDAAEAGPRASSELMAKILGISTVSLGRFAKEGVIPPSVERGSWSIVPVVNAYLNHVEATAERGKKSEELRVEELAVAKARRAKAEAETAAVEMSNAERRNELVRRDDVNRAVIAIFAMVRTRLLAIPNGVAAKVVNVSREEAESIIRDAVNDALDDLSEARVEAETSAPASKPTRRIAGARTLKVRRR